MSAQPDDEESATRRRVTRRRRAQRGEAPRNREPRLAEDASARVASLKKLREALLVTYQEDAQPVKDVDEEIAKANKSLDQLQSAAEILYDFLRSPL